MQGLVPAAGRGTRLGALTDERPKGLVEVAERPLLAYAFDAAIDAGVTELVVVVGYEGAQIVDRFGDAYRDVPLTYVHQRERLGLGHAVLQAEPHVDERFLLVNGDNVFADALDPVVEAADSPGVDGALAVESVSREVARTTGVLELDDGTVTGIVEKPDEAPSTLVTTGCYVLPPEIFRACRLLRPTAEGEYQLSEAVGLLLHAGYTFETVEAGDRVNVNTPEDLDRAAALVS
ncbi:nucleotidyltransferase family protein [Halobellus limi]|uniref:Glucose-1-phosphate thymidylyltransferase n=1 Tax=Halobellus limi TaxID=699433 RepID=A0A1H5TW12_9EURY|nr:sugar phosphate nucleotidyltransferase [Halobellus limi]QCC47228.1 sugar nucleotidyltransferase [Halobellus limi]SEF66398.1 glucose-1-phosphate thymidylyltransferase [Halobellus limi]